MVSSASSDSEAESKDEPVNPILDKIQNSESEEKLSDRKSSGNNNISFYLRQIRNAVKNPMVSLFVLEVLLL